MAALELYLPLTATDSDLPLPAAVPAFPRLRERLVVCFLSGVRSKLSSSSAEGWGEGRGTQKLGSSTSIVNTLLSMLSISTVFVWKSRLLFFKRSWALIGILPLPWAITNLHHVYVRDAEHSMSTLKTTATKPNTVSSKSQAQMETEEYLSRIRLKEIFQVDKIVPLCWLCKFVQLLAS